MLNVVFLLNVVVSLNFYEVYMITENSEDILVLSIGDVISMQYGISFCQTRFQNSIKNASLDLININMDAMCHARIHA